MTKTTAVSLSIVTLLIGFILGVYGSANTAQNLGGTTYDASRLVGDVYNGMSEVLMMTNGFFVGPVKDQAETVTGTTTVTVGDTSAVFYLTAGGAYTLPAVADAEGVSYRFTISSAITQNGVITSAEGDNIEGSLIVAGAVVDCDASDVITFVADGENLGDFVDIYSNGSKWFIGASGTLTSAKMTCSG